jgi:hypothetical protein
VIDESLHPIEGDVPFLRAIGTFQMDLSHGIPREMFTPRGLLVKFSERSFGKKGTLAAMDFTATLVTSLNVEN